MNRIRFVLILLALAAVAVAAGLAVTVLMGSDDPGAAAAPVAAGPIAAHGDGAVRATSGSDAKIRYRVDGLSDEPVWVRLVVTRRGRVARVLVGGRWVRSNVGHSWSGRLHLAPGSYTYEVFTGGGADRRRVLSYSGSLVVRPRLVPTESAVESAAVWARTRAASPAFAVVDSWGRLRGLGVHRTFASASVVKAMLLVAYLRAHETVSAGMQATLTQMIEYSDNSAADIVYGDVGREGLVALARTARMDDFAPSGGWITTRISAADMARFFRDMESYFPAGHRALARELLSGVTSRQRWGIPPAAEPAGYTVYFKGGWLGANVLANQAARLERGDLCLGLAVLTDGNPSSGYGLETIRGITERLLEE